MSNLGDKNKNAIPFVELKIYVSVRAKKSELRGWYDDRIKISLAAIPENGLANQELILFFSKFLQIPQGRISLTQGSQSKLKTIRIEGITDSELPPALIRSN